jgi:putative transposase
LSGNHAGETLACDFFVAVTATFRLVYVFLVLEIGTRRIRHRNTTEHPMAEWTTQQFRSCVTGEEPYRFVVHDRDAIYSPAVDRALRSMNLRVLKTPPGVPQANAFAERFVRTIKESCLDRLILIGEASLRRAVCEFLAHYHNERNHQGLQNQLITRPGARRGTDRSRVVSGWVAC